MKQKVAEFDQFQVRLPAGMRDRIRAAADASNRSMNAEIVATLEEKYPPLQPLYSKSSSLGLKFGYLHWLKKDSKWVSVESEVWDILRTDRLYISGISKLTVGENYFVVLVFDKDGTILNIIPHMYKLDEYGKIVGDVFDILSADELDEYNSHYTSHVTDKARNAAFKEMQDRMSPYLIPGMLARVELRKLLLRYNSDEIVDAVLERTDLSAT